MVIDDVRLPPTTLRAFVEAIDRVMMQDYSSMIDQCVMVTRDGARAIMELPEEDAEGILDPMHAAMEAIDAVRCVCVSEAWTGEPEDLESIRAHVDSGCSLGSHPRVREVLVYYAEDETEGSILAQRDILGNRDARGYPELGPLRFVDEVHGARPPRGRVH